ncbi:MAG: uroporphyrinogen-III synthase, partial [Desulfosalsimonas sp.]
MLKKPETRPLFGKRIAVTRARSQASSLVSRLSELGASVIEAPAIKIRPVEDLSLLDEAIENLDRYHWLVFTSVNGVDSFFSRLKEHGKDARALGGAGTAAIGPATAARMKENGVRADIIPESYRAESVVSAFADLDMAGKRVLLPRAEGARAVLPEELSKMGARVDEIISYRAVQAEDRTQELVESLKAGAVNMITLPALPRCATSWHC